MTARVVINVYCVTDREEKTRNEKTSGCLLNKFRKDYWWLSLEMKGLRKNEVHRKFKCTRLVIVKDNNVVTYFLFIYIFVIRKTQTDG